MKRECENWGVTIMIVDCNNVFLCVVRACNSSSVSGFFLLAGKSINFLVNWMIVNEINWALQNINCNIDNN